MEIADKKCFRTVNPFTALTLCLLNRKKRLPVYELNTAGNSQVTITQTGGLF
ncbi:protein of unknown function [Maridesulfovibrio hydrothermalis AM13 = DSM 14728]|uniref:Uncharacterized protein n=1 Tax=Maridesulfovibrio hydrothermalis AM13 = DSM 14728 TaxID=1121451 RepID=L0R8L1_9BACT|nr:protein of unknown function [Maridesulfovibrio hydrothermalis AM13 = DSM 14728]